MKKFLQIVLLVVTFLLSVNSGALAQYTINAEVKEVYQEIDGNKCGIFSGCSVAGEPIEFNLSGLSYSTGEPIEAGSYIEYKVNSKGSGCIDWPSGGGRSTFWTGENGFNITVPGNMVRSGCQYSLELYRMTGNSVGSESDLIKQFKYNSPYSLPVQASCSETQCNEDLSISTSASYELCAQIQTGTPQYDACFSCFNSQGVWTAVGCIPSEPENVIRVVITIGLALGGGVVLIMILVGSFMLSVSQGDPNKTKEAKEIISSAIIGLLFVIFSVTLLQFIGVSVLQIPGFGE